ncbi:MAG: nucleotidyltransferase family protein [Clostridia bacterium]|nr:nucleotidyltransferase family protein [Clostridia bacterium]
MRKISPSERTLLALLARALFARPLPTDLDTADMAAVLDAAERHMVFGVASDALADLPENALPSSVLYRWKNDTVQLLRQNAALLAFQAELTDFLARADIPFAILKGSAVARLYPSPDLRVCGDVDCLLPKESISRVSDFLTEQGFVPEINEGEHHLTYVRDKLEIELHTHAAGIPEGEIGAQLTALLADTVETAVPASICGIDFYKPEPVREALVLLLHMLHHMQDGGLGLRQVLDFALFAKAELHGDTLNRLLPLLHAYGLFTFAATLTDLCVRHLGLDADCAAWRGAVDPALSDALLADFLDSGNFGKGAQAYAGSGIVTKERRQGEGALRAGLRGIAAKCRAEWPICARHGVFLLFFVPFWLIRRPFRKNEVRVHPLRMLRAARRRTKLYDKLALFQTKP